MAIVGENGAGKSTLMKILGGIYLPDSGNITLNGKPLRLGSVTEAMRSGISLIHQELNLAENLSVTANLFLGREHSKGGPLGLLDNGRMFREAKALLQRVGLECSPRTIVGRLSPGQKQLVEIARALSMNVRILIMDEPTSSLTNQETQKLFQVIDDLRASNVAILYISHRLAEVERVADRVVVLRDGKLAGELFRGFGDDAISFDAIAEGALDSNIFTKKKKLVSELTAAEEPSAEPDANISHESMVRLMVGRDLNKFFQRSHAPKSDRKVLELREVCYQGVPGLPSGISSPTSLAVREGEILGMAGLVGAGRTELAEAIFGLRRIISGKIFLGGKQVHFPSPKKAIAAGVLLVPEDRRYHGLILQDTVSHNISLPNLRFLSHFLFVSRRQESSLAQDMCLRLNIRTPKITQTVGLLSGGNQQKVVLSKWLARKQRVLIVDEPTRGVDVGAKSEIYTILDNLAGEGVAILMISSDLEEILGMSDRVAVLHQGKVSGILNRQELREEAIMQLATGGSVP